MTHQLVIFIKRGAEREMAILRFDRTDPYLKNLLTAAEIRIGLKLKHSAWEVFDVSVVAVVQTARFTQALIKIAVAGTMLSKVRSDDSECMPVFVGARQRNGKAKRGCGRTGFALHNLDFGSQRLSWESELCAGRFALRQFRKVGFDSFWKTFRIPSS